MLYQLALTAIMEESLSKEKIKSSILALLGDE